MTNRSRNSSPKKEVLNDMELTKKSNKIIYIEGQQYKSSKKNSSSNLLKQTYHHSESHYSSTIIAKLYEFFQRALQLRVRKAKDQDLRELILEFKLEQDFIDFAMLLRMNFTFQDFIFFYLGHLFPEEQIKQMFDFYCERDILIEQELEFQNAGADSDTQSQSFILGAGQGFQTFRRESGQSFNRLTQLTQIIQSKNVSAKSNITTNLFTRQYSTAIGSGRPQTAIRFRKQASLGGETQRKEGSSPGRVSFKNVKEDQIDEFEVNFNTLKASMTSRNQY